MKRGKQSELFFDLGRYQTRVDGRLAEWKEKGFLKRLWEKDPTLWFPTPVPEITDRLGWLTLPKTMSDNLDGVLRLAEGVKADGLAQVVLLGMGGSSLTPEVFARSFGSRAGYPRLVILDSTHPEAVRSLEAGIDLRETLFIVSSKSGTTLETLSLFKYFWKRASDQVSTPGRHFIAISDPGSPLTELAGKRGFRFVVPAPPDVGGRYSALSVFGLVPAALIGLDVHKLMESASLEAAECAPGVSEMKVAGLSLGAALGELAGDRNKVTLLTPPELSSFSDWLEQLIAESTGKEGKGIFPVVSEPYALPGSYGKDRLFVGIFLRNARNDKLENQFSKIEACGLPTIRIDLEDLYTLGREFYRWEMAVASAGAVMGIHPFNQPDVQLAKDFAKRIMLESTGNADPHERDLDPADTLTADDQPALASALNKWVVQVQQGDYIALQAYLAPSPPLTAALQGIRSSLLKKTRMATSFGYGPRFLHSTGQLHKGGPNNGLFLQLVDDTGKKVPVPESGYAFNDVIRAQAVGDYRALLQRRRRVLRIDLREKALEGLQSILAHVSR
ncbi:MAG: hypothetical protein JXB23_12680 [Candidatus Aminicenantes bacterium]|nr:hypothetical protein [Candidatus Aminicenantes bacterium]